MTYEPTIIKKEIQAASKLPAAEVKRLRHKARRGDNAAREQLIYSGLLWSRAIAQRYLRLGIEYDDCLQETALAVCMAADRYNPRYPFTNYVYVWARKRVIDTLRRESADARHRNHVAATNTLAFEDEWTEPHDDSGNTRWAIAKRVQTSDYPDFYRALLKLSNRELAVMVLRYGLVGAPTLTQQKVGALCGVSKQRIGQLETRARELLRFELRDRIETRGDECSKY